MGDLFDGSGGPGTFGFEMNAALARVDALPWWLWLYKFRVRRRAQAVKRLMEEQRDAFIERVLSRGIDKARNA